MREFRIALCCEGKNWGGVETHVLALSRALNRIPGVRATVLLLADGRFSRELVSRGIEHRRLHLRFKRDLSVAIPMARFLKSSSFDIVHAHGYKAAVLAGLAAAIARLPFIRTEHGLPEPFRGLASVNMALNLWAARAITHLLRGRVIYVCRSVRDYYQRFYRHNGGAVIHNGLDLSLCEIPPRRETPANATFTVAVIGRLVPVKGHVYFLDAVRKIGQSGIFIKGLIIGEGPEEKKLRDFCRQAQIEDRIEFLGFRRDGLDLLDTSDVLVVPSLNEGIPYCVLEAMALGKPIVASMAGGLLEILQDQKDCLFVPPGDCSALSVALTRLKENPTLRNSLGEAARKKVTSLLSADRMAAAHLRFYKRVRTEMSSGKKR